MARVARTDFAGTLGSVERTPQGGLRVPAAVTRVGVLRYKDSNGREWGELRPPEEVFAEDSLATLRGAPVTDLHPSDMVTSETWKTLAVGHAGDTVTRDGDFVTTPLTIQDAAMVALIDAGERRETSCGYTCETDPTPGVYDGQAYDVVQRRIRYNHVGLGPVGWGRAGSEVSLRMDGAAVHVRADSTNARGSAKGQAMFKIKIRGREYRIDAEGDMVPVQAAVDETVAKADADGAELAAVKAALMDALTKIAAYEAKMTAAAAAQPAAVTEEQVSEAVADSIAAKRLALWTEARTVLGAEEKFDGKSATDIRRAVVTKAFPETKLDGFSADTIDGMYRAAVLGASQRNDGLGEAHRNAVGDAGTARRDGAKDPAAEMRERTANRWQKPLTVSGKGS